jgi:ArsR family transcriptional regulator, arsenate/arsenite/antimonite-responsive transcriptional repressor
MKTTEAIAALSALAQSTRLETFRLLVRREPDGVPATELARLMAVPQNTMSAHLAILARAGLIIGERQSRSIMRRSPRHMRAARRRSHPLPPAEGSRP